MSNDLMFIFNSCIYCPFVDVLNKRSSIRTWTNYLIIKMHALHGNLLWSAEFEARDYGAKDFTCIIFWWGVRLASCFCLYNWGINVYIHLYICAYEWLRKTSTWDNCWIGGMAWCCALDRSVIELYSYICLFLSQQIYKGMLGINVLTV